ncbi:MAG: UDP-N-acetyl-D-glucosamine dehydrogenase [Planctomycetota bacterium]
MKPEAKLKQRIATRSASVGVIGLGYVGLPLCHALLEGELHVVGYDTDTSKVDDLDKGRSYLAHLGEPMAKDFAKSDRFSATSDFDSLGQRDVVVVCVPTPIGPHQEPDLSYVHTAAAAIGRCLRKGQLIILESTTYPGTTRDEFLPTLLAACQEKMRVGKDIFVAYSPEREDPGRSTHERKQVPKLVGGLDEASTELASALYATGFEHVVPVSSAEVAEAAKLLENIFRSVNIALVNEMKTILTAMDIDVWEVVAAAATKPYGFMPFQPGPGLGGHCIPIDPFYLAWKAKEVGRPTRFIELAGAINREMPAWVVQRSMLALNERGKAMKNADVLVLGLAYKKNVDDTRESPSFEIIERLRALGARVEYSDPHIARTRPTRAHDLKLDSQPLDAETIAAQDVILIATDHADVDYAAIAEHAKLVIDTRDVMRPYVELMGERLVRA